MSADDQNVTSVIEQLRNREKAGLIKYGTNTERTDLETIEWLQHLQEELMDGAVYIERLKRDLSEQPELEESTGSLMHHADWHEGHEPQVAGQGDIHEQPVEGEDYDNYGTYTRAMYLQHDNYAQAIEDIDSTPQHIKIPEDD